MAIIPPFSALNYPDQDTFLPLDTHDTNAPASTTEQTHADPLPHTHADADQSINDCLPEDDLTQQIYNIQEQFHALGVSDPQTVVPLWLGKRNHYDGKLLQDPDDVLQYFTRMKADTVAVSIQPEPLVDKEDPEVVAAKDAARAADRVARANKKAEIEAAGAAWRKAVADRKAVVSQWDAYVHQLHQAFKDLKASL